MIKDKAKGVRASQFSGNMSNGHYTNQITNTFGKEQEMGLQDQIYHEISQGTGFSSLTEAQQERLQRERMKETPKYQMCPALA